MNISELINKLSWLADKENGIGLPLTVLGKYCNCSAVSIHNYITRKTLPTGRMINYISNGLTKLYNDFIQEMGM